MNCLRCVQNCTRGVVTRTINPEFRWLGDSYWKPEILLSLWYQSETGKIPVSGAGYRGPFSGPGFDAMWTDMSEIVRPTRDGIHGREYISTSVDLGAKVRDLAFDEQGSDLHRRAPRARAAGAVRAGEPALRRLLAAGLRGGRPRGARDGDALRDRPRAGHRESEAVPGGARAGRDGRDDRAATRR